MRIPAYFLTMAMLGVAVVGVNPAPASATPVTSENSLNLNELIRNSSPGLGDVDGDGVDDLLIASEEGILRVYKSGDLTNLLWSMSAIPYVPAGCTAQSTPSAIDSNPVVADIDNDGSNDIIIGMQSTYRKYQNGGLQALNNDGSVKWHWTGSTDNPDNGGPIEGSYGWCEGVHSTPSIGDVDGDGNLDVVFGGWDRKVHALDGETGNELPGFPFNIVDTIWSSPALYDIDSDGRMEIFIGGDDTGGSPGHTDGGQVHGLSLENGVVSVIWKRHPDETIMGDVAIGDINGDGRVEMIVNPGDFYNNADTQKIFAFHLDDGTDVPGWPVSLSGTVHASVALADLDGDAQLDVIGGTISGNAYAIRGDGTFIWQTSICCNPAAPSLNGIDGAPIVADFDGDGDSDVALGTGWGLQILNGQTGVRMQELAIGVSRANAAVVGDFGDRGRHLITTGFDLTNSTTRISDFKVYSTAPAAWPTSRGVQGGFPAQPPCPDANPTGATGATITGDGYWMLGAGGIVYNFGDASHYGSADTALGGTTTRAVDLEPTSSYRGYWILDSRGCVQNFGDAEHYGNVDPLLLTGGERIASLSAVTDGYIIFTSRGRAITFGAASSFGDATSLPLNGPVLGSVTTPDGNGYYMVASDGGVFAYGNASFKGSMGNAILNQPVMDLVPTADNGGYWQVASDGGIFAFGNAAFKGSMGGTTLNAPIVGMVRYGNGYLMVGADGGIFNFSNKDFKGSLGGNPPSVPIVTIAALG